MELLESILVCFISGSFLLSGFAIIIFYFLEAFGHKDFSAYRFYRVRLIFLFQLLAVFVGFVIAMVAVNFVPHQEGRLVGKECLMKGINLSVPTGTLLGWIYVFGLRKNRQEEITQ